MQLLNQTILYDEAESKKYNFVPNRLEDAEINFIYETDKTALHLLLIIKTMKRSEPY